MMRRQHKQFADRLPSVALFTPIVCFSLVLVHALGVLPADVAGQPRASEVERESVQKTVESLALIVGREYFDPGVAARVGTSLRERLGQGRYDKAPTPQ